MAVHKNKVFVGKNFTHRVENLLPSYPLPRLSPISYLS